MRVSPADNTGTGAPSLHPSPTIYCAGTDAVDCR
jgi:hypothetical protein